MDTPHIRLEPPKWIVDRITLVGGKNPYGRPNFRVIWGGNRTHKVGGKFKQPVYFNDAEGHKKAVVTEIIELRELLSYHPERWHLERWRSSDWYGSPKEWCTNSWDPELRLHTLGPYPYEGDYEHVFYLAQCNHLTHTGDWCSKCIVGCGEYIPLEENFHLIELQINLLLRSENVNAVAERDALFLREDKKRQVMREIVGQRVRNAMRPTLATQPTSWQDGSRCSVPEAKWGKEIPMPRSVGMRQIEPDANQKKIVRDRLAKDGAGTIVKV